MKVLIDEQLLVKLKCCFTDTTYEVFTVRDMNWLGKKNGELLELMGQNKFNVLVTNDKSVYHQQRMKNHELVVLNINTRTNDYDDVMQVLSEIRKRLNEIAIQILNQNQLTTKYIMLPSFEKQ